MIRFFRRYFEFILQIFSKNKFLGFGFFLTLAQVISGAFGYLFQILIGRMLSPGDFAIFSSLMASFMFLAAPMVAVSMIIVRKVSSFKANEKLFLVKPYLFQLYKILIVVSIAILILFWLVDASLSEFLRIPNTITLFLFEVILIFSLFNTVNNSIFQGLQKFIFMAVIGLISVLLKIILSTALISFGLALNGALLGTLLSMGIVILVSISMLLPKLPSYVSMKRYQIDISSTSKIYPVFAATIAAAAMTQLDMVLVNWYFSPEDAGLYAAASVLGKAILYLPGGLIIALFPMVAELHTKGKSGLKIFQQAILATLFFCGSISFFYWMFGDSIILFFYGPNYYGAGEILRWYGFAILPMAIVIISEQYLIAKGQVLFAWVFLAIAPLQILAIYIWHTELWMIILSMGIFGSLLALIGILFMYYSRKLKVSSV